MARPKRRVPRKAQRRADQPGLGAEEERIPLEAATRQLRAEKQTAEALFGLDARRVMSKEDREEAVLCVRQAARWLTRLREVLRRLDSQPEPHRSTLLPLVEELGKRLKAIARLAEDRAKAFDAETVMATAATALTELSDSVLAAAFLQRPRGQGRPPSANEWFTPRAHDLLRRAGITAREKRNEILVKEGLKPAE